MFIYAQAPQAQNLPHVPGQAPIGERALGRGQPVHAQRAALRRARETNAACPFRRALAGPDLVVRIWRWLGRAPSKARVESEQDTPLCRATEARPFGGPRRGVVGLTRRLPHVGRTAPEPK